MNTFTPKNPAEEELFSFDFVDNLGKFETIVSATSSITVKEGTDPGVGTMLMGSPTFVGSVVTQKVQAGVDGVYYYLQVNVVTTEQTLVGRAVLPVSIEK